MTPPAARSGQPPPADVRRLWAATFLALAVLILMPGSWTYVSTYRRVASVAQTVALPPDALRLTQRFEAGGRFGPAAVAFLFGAYPVGQADILFASDEPPDVVFTWYRANLDSQRWVWQFDPPHSRTMSFERRAPPVPDVVLTVRHVWPGRASLLRNDADAPIFAASGRRFGYVADLYYRGWFEGEQE